MNIVPARRSRRGSVLLFILFATLAVMVGGVIVYHIYRWARRCDTGAPVDRPGITNSDAIPTPGNGGVDITGAWWQDCEVHAEWWDGSVASPLEQQEPEAYTNCVVYGSLDGSNVLLSIGREVTTNRDVKFSDIGMPVDSYGIPTDFNWHWNEPAGNPEECVLQSSTNMIDWEDVILWRIWPGYTSAWAEPFGLSERYYRTIR